MIFTPNSNPTEVTFNSDTNIVTINQRVFGSERINTVSIDLANLNEFLSMVEA